MLYEFACSLLTAITVALVRLLALVFSSFFITRTTTESKAKPRIKTGYPSTLVQGAGQDPRVHVDGAQGQADNSHPVFEDGDQNCENDQENSIEVRPQK